VFGMRRVDAVPSENSPFLLRGGCPVHIAVSIAIENLSALRKYDKLKRVTSRVRNADCFLVDLRT
jgi:hypothetical protein